MSDATTEVDSRSSSRSTRSWCIFGQRLPREEFTFATQVIVLYTVILVSIYNLTTGTTEKDNLWTALLSSSLGYLLPNPAMPKKAI